MRFKVHIRWSDFITYEDILTSDADYAKSHKGIYYIYQIKDSEAFPYYIGKSANNFYARLHDHRVNPNHRITYVYKDKVVQLASIHVDGGISSRMYEEILDDMESVLIFSVNYGRDLPKNVAKTKTINIHHDYVIVNEGYLPAGISMRMEAKQGYYVVK